MSVATRPGCTDETRIPLGRSSSRIASVRARAANFDAE